MAVADELAGGERRRHEFGTIDDGVEAALEQADHVFAGITRAARGFLVVFAELALGDVAVIALELLLGLQLRAIVRQLLGAALAMLTRAIRALVHGALVAAPDALAHAAVDLVLCRCALAHSCLRLSNSVWRTEPRRSRNIVSHLALSIALKPWKYLTFFYVLNLWLRSIALLLAVSRAHARKASS